MGWVGFFETGEVLTTYLQCLTGEAVVTGGYIITRGEALRVISNGPDPGPVGPPFGRAWRIDFLNEGPPQDFELTTIIGCTNAWGPGVWRVYDLSPSAPAREEPAVVPHYAPKR